jgi:hypothetical protein
MFDKGGYMNWGFQDKHDRYLIGQNKSGVDPGDRHTLWMEILKVYHIPKMSLIHHSNDSKSTLHTIWVWYPEQYFHY